jgi:hypothetical protein
VAGQKGISGSTSLGPTRTTSPLSQSLSQRTSANGAADRLTVLRMQVNEEMAEGALLYTLDIGFPVRRCAGCNRSGEFGQRVEVHVVGNCVYDIGEHCGERGRQYHARVPALGRHHSLVRGRDCYVRVRREVRGRPWWRSSVAWRPRGNSLGSSDALRITRSRSRGHDGLCM